MKYLRLVLLILLAGPAVAYAASRTCPEVSDFECLVKNSLQVYREDYEHWWSIYRHALAKARECKDPKDLALFLRLWSGQTDGEMAEGLSDDTQAILTKNSSCFFEGFLALPASDRAAFVSSFCPLGEAEAASKALKQAAQDPRYEASANQILQRIESKSARISRARSYPRKLGWTPSRPNERNRD